jgi:MASE9 protein
VIASRAWPVHAYLALVIISGLAALAAAAARWQSDDPARFAVYLLLACFAGALKVRLPGMTGTYSLTFLFVLLGVADLRFAETVVIAGVSMIVQCVWGAATRPSPVQVLFNTAATSVAAALAYLGPRWAGLTSLAVELPLAAAVYFLVNTLLVAGILAQVEQRAFGTVWRDWFRWSLTYYLAGVAVSAVVILSSRHFGWQFSLLLLPLMYLEYLCFRLKVDSERDTGPVAPSS